MRYNFDWELSRLGGTFSLMFFHLIGGCVNMNTDYLKEFERMNETTESVFELGESGLLIILNDGTNLTSWGGCQ